jgi:hypothetical protein
MVDWEDKDIIEAFHGVIRDCNSLNEEQLSLKYAKFKEEIPKMYQVAIDSVVNGNVQNSLNKLSQMLSMRSKVRNKQVTGLHADMHIGNLLGKEYIYPVTETPSNEDYVRAVREISKKVDNQLS